MTKHLFFVLSLFFFLLVNTVARAQEKGIIINETSNGSGGIKEYVELLVVGPPCETVDLRTWIVDDNNGDFSNNADGGEGIAAGHLRFKNVIQWQNISTGTIIVIYNPDDINPQVPADDELDSNNDDVYILPISSSLIEVCTSFPSSSNSSYTGCTYGNESDFGAINLRNGGDAQQTRKPDFTFFHGLSYGTTSSSDNFDGGPDGIHIAEDGGSKVFFFTSGSFRDVANFTFGSVPNDETPGLPNNAANATYINDLKQGTQNKDLVADDTIFCKGSSVDLEVEEIYDAYEWSQGANILGTNFDITISTAGTYTIKVTENGCDYEDEIIVAESDPAPDAGQDVTICRGDEVILNGIGNGTPKWTPNEHIDDVNSYNPKVTPLETKTYTLTVTDVNDCVASDDIVVTVEGPIAELDVDKKAICLGEDVNFSFLNPSGIDLFDVNYGNGSEQLNVPYNASNTFLHTYDSVFVGGIANVVITLKSNSNSCEYVLDTVINVNVTIAGFDRNTFEEPNFRDTSRCFEPNDQMLFINTSSGYSYWRFDFGDGETTDSNMDAFPINHVYDNPGVYDLKLFVSNTQLGCEDSITKKLYLKEELTLNLPLGDFITVCANNANSVQLEANAGQGATYKWTPSQFLNFDTVPNPIANIFESTTFNVEAVDASGCTGNGQIEVEVLKAPILSDGFDCLTFGDTTIEYGESLALSFLTNDDRYEFNWSPSDYLSCDDCFDPIVIEPQESIEYIVNVKDTSDLNCFDINYTVCITVDKRFTIDVPSAFSPNADGVNDEIFVNGIGIEELLSFQIFNRWGQMVFESSDITIGWDGKRNSVLQEQDVYMYQVTAKAKNGEVKREKGSFTLLR